MCCIDGIAEEVVTFDVAGIIERNYRDALEAQANGRGGSPTVYAGEGDVPECVREIDEGIAWAVEHDALKRCELDWVAQHASISDDDQLDAARQRLGSPYYCAIPNVRLYRDPASAMVCAVADARIDTHWGHDEAEGIPLAQYFYGYVGCGLISDLLEHEYLPEHGYIALVIPHGPFGNCHIAVPWFCHEYCWTSGGWTGGDIDDHEYGSVLAKCGATREEALRSPLKSYCFADDDITSDYNDPRRAERSALIERLQDYVSALAGGKIATIGFEF